MNTILSFVLESTKPRKTVFTCVLSILPYLVEYAQGSRAIRLALWTPFSGFGLHIGFIHWNWERVVHDGYLSRQGVSSRRTEPTWAERQVHFGTVGHCDISSDSLSFLWWPTQSELSLAPSPILYHECETAKVSRSAGTLRWQTGSGEYSYFLFRRWPTKVLLFIMNWMMMPT